MGPRSATRPHPNRSSRYGPEVLPISIMISRAPTIWYDLGVFALGVALVTPIFVRLFQTILWFILDL